MPGPAFASILIVDDDEGLLRLVEKTLRREGFTIRTANSGREAIDWLCNNNTNLLLLDLKLPDIEGKDLINHLAQMQRSVPFIVITGLEDARVAVEMMKRGALDYLVKDVQFIEFVPTVVRRALERLENEKRLLTAQSALKESQEQLLAVSEREQARFGAELHDGLGQQLTAIELRCQSMKADLPPRRPDLTRQISEISQFLREAIAQTRSLARGLSPVHLGSGGFVEALGELAARMSKDKQIKCIFDSSTKIDVDDDRIASHLFRIAQEAVNNAVKHSGASEVLLRINNSDGALHLEISDNGKGLPKGRQANQGIGMQIMKHRASVIGAELQIKSETDKGVKIICTLKRKH
jgi:signal transduction histidine kinase